MVDDRLQGLIHLLLGLSTFVAWILFLVYFDVPFPSVGTIITILLSVVWGFEFGTATVLLTVRDKGEY